MTLAEINERCQLLHDTLKPKFPDLTNEGIAALCGYYSAFVLHSSQNLTFFMSMGQTCYDILTETLNEPKREEAKTPDASDREG